MDIEKTIGVLGGLGPEATVLVFQMILEQTPAKKDQEHLRILIDNNPKIPERLPAILGTGPDPVPMMVSSARILKNAGADFLIIPCVSAHYFLDRIRREISVPILSMLDEAAAEIKGADPAVKTVGLLAAEGTMKSGLFQERLSREGIQTIIPEGEDRAEVQKLIFQIKDTGSKSDRRKIGGRFVEIGERMIRRGARAILVGCTEISIVVEEGAFGKNGFDALRILAGAAVREARGNRG